MSKPKDPATPNRLYGIHEGSDVDISKYKWMGISREGYAPMSTDAAIQAIILAERERCAVLAECASTRGNGDLEWDRACEFIAQAIRRGK